MTWPETLVFAIIVVLLVLAICMSIRINELEGMVRTRDKLLKLTDEQHERTVDMLLAPMLSKRVLTTITLNDKGTIVASERFTP